jgi:hypothetical protein
MSRRVLALFSALIVFPSLFSLPAGAQTPPALEIPSELRPWVPWVMYDSPKADCAQLRPGRFECSWPGHLVLRGDGGGATFSLTLSVGAPTWVRLPGGDRFWPQEVRRDGATAVVVRGSGDVPQVLLAAGRHTLTGKFVWSEVPEVLAVSPATGRIDLEINGEPVAHPRLDAEGRLWLQGGASAGRAAEEADAIRVAVFRRFQDGVPLRVTNRMDLTVSGRAREVSLGSILLPGSIAVSVRSGLPVQISGGGEVKVYVKPGSHHIEVDTLMTAPMTEILVPKATADFFDPQEVWVWKPNATLRAVEVSGLQAVDPERTSLPDDWARGGTAYLAEPGQRLSLAETRRGESEPTPNAIRLRRKLWMDLDGRGYTVQDRLTGQMNQGWRLNYAGAGELGRVGDPNSGENLLITKDPLDGARGVELRNSKLNLEAELRLDDARGELDIVGWDHDVQSLSAELNLPPGWQLIGGRGVDKMPGTWIESWTLFDFFLLLMIALAIGKLCGWRWAPVAALALGLSHGQGAAPLWVWVHLLASLALLRALPEGWIRRGVLGYRAAALLCLAVILAPYAKEQVRFALHPQVERGGVDTTGTGLLLSSDTSLDDMERSEQPAAMGAAAEPEEGRSKRDNRKEKKARFVKGKRDYKPNRQALLQQVDPNAVVQTGPGVPTWSWNQWSLSWSGPVRKDHQVHLWLLTPWMSRALTGVRVVLLILLALLLIQRREMTWVKGAAPMGGSRKFLWLVTLLFIPASVVAVATLGSPSPAHAQEQQRLIQSQGIGQINAPNQSLGAFGSPEAGPRGDVLSNLKDRILASQRCEGACVVASRADIRVDGLKWTMRAEVHAQKLSGWLLPGPADPLRIIRVTVDGVPTTSLRRESGGLLAVRLPAGRSEVVVEGVLVDRNVVTVQFDAESRPRFVTFESAQWSVDGIGITGVPDSSLQLTRTGERGKDDSGGAEMSAELPPWYRVDRTLELGLPWKMQTEVVRVDSSRPALVKIPLVGSEKVISESVRVENGMVLVEFPRGTSRVAYTGELAIAPELELTAAKGQPWTETWAVACSRIWRCTFSGLPPVTTVSAEGSFEPRWKPWPGEALSIEVGRPKGAPGQAATVDSVEYVVTPGKRLLEGRLTLQIRASQGGWHKVTLPADAELQSVKIDGVARNVRPQDGVVPLPIQPGKQSFELVWQQPWERGVFETIPPVTLGSKAVNAKIKIELGSDRWLLWTTGPSWGPAVLYWSHLVILLLVAFLLGRIRSMPLRGYEWLLLVIGMTQMPFVVVLVPVAWFAMLAWRKRSPLEAWWQFDVFQLFLIFWTLVSVGVLYAAIHSNLLFDIDMQVRGAGSTNHLMQWYADQVPEALPSAGVISLPIMVWRVAMLLWALWLVARLLKWLPWGWGAFSQDGLYKLWPKPVRAGNVEGDAQKDSGGDPSDEGDATEDAAEPAPT